MCMYVCTYKMGVGSALLRVRITHALGQGIVPDWDYTAHAHNSRKITVPVKLILNTTIKCHSYYN